MSVIHICFYIFVWLGEQDNFDEVIKKKDLKGRIKLIDENEQEKEEEEQGGNDDQDEVARESNAGGNDQGGNDVVDEGEGEGYQD